MELKLDFDERPFIVIWETTQACDLACVHCRACAQPVRSALELCTAEAKRLIDEVAALRAPVFVLTGGEPCCIWLPKACPTEEADTEQICVPVLGSDAGSATRQMRNDERTDGKQQRSEWDQAGRTA